MAVVEPFVDCNEELGRPERLRARGAANGYLFFPGLLPSAEVLALRRAVLGVAEEHHLLRPGSDRDAALRRDGIYVDVEHERDPTPEVRNFYNAVLGLRSFNAFFHHRASQEIQSQRPPLTVWADAGQPSGTPLFCPCCDAAPGPPRR